MINYSLEVKRKYALLNFVDIWIWDVLNVVLTIFTLKFNGDGRSLLYRHFDVFGVYMDRYKALDGLRGVSVLLVILHHFGSKVIFPGGFFGVDVFFVLSGFLITTILLKEYSNTQNISFRHFYYNRFLRLFMPFFLMSLSFLLGSLIFDLYKTNTIDTVKQFLFGLLCISNYTYAFHLTDTMILGHTWSLSIEQQFYLIWPLALFLLLKRYSIETLFKICVGIVGVLICTRIGYFCFGVNPSYIDGAFESRSSSIWIGSLFAIYQKLPQKNAKWQSPLLTYFCLGLLVFCVQFTYLINTHLLTIFIFPTIGFLVFCILNHLLNRPSKLLQSIFQNSILTHCGKISYSLYLWHFPIFLAIWSQNLPTMYLLIVGLPLTYLISLLSWKYMEEPLQRLRHKVT